MRHLCIILLAAAACQPNVASPPELAGGGGNGTADAGVGGSNDAGLHCGDRRLGESWEHSDGCNTCTCLEQGVACTDEVCPEGPCGDREVGEIWDHEDGCNQCACTERGIACTNEACGGPGRGEVLQECESDRDCEEGSRCRPAHQTHGGRVGLPDELHICLPDDCRAGPACPAGFLCTDWGDCRVTHGCEEDRHCAGDEICDHWDHDFRGCWTHPECHREPCPRHCDSDEQCTRGFRCEQGSCFSPDAAYCDRHGMGPAEQICRPGNRQSEQEPPQRCNPMRNEIQCPAGEHCVDVQSSVDLANVPGHGVCVGRLCQVLEDCPFNQYCNRGHCQQGIACHPGPHEACREPNCGLDQFCLHSHGQGGGSARCLSDQRCEQDEDCPDGLRCNGLHCIGTEPCHLHELPHYDGICIPSIQRDNDDHANSPGAMGNHGTALSHQRPLEAELTAFDIDWFHFTSMDRANYVFRTEGEDGGDLDSFCMLANADSCTEANDHHEDSGNCWIRRGVAAGELVFFGVRLQHPHEGQRERYRVIVERQ